jgi:hypothetical protein
MTRTRLKHLASLVICITLILALGAGRPAPAGPALVVVLTVDQLRGDYLLRWQGQWRGGFRRFLDSGAVFPNALQDHALTETAPGHATVLSGRDPAHTGIVINELGVPDSTAPIVGAPNAPGASPRRFVGTTLVDWMLQADPGFRFLSVSRKDRGAILPIGRMRGPVFWYVGGRFTTSTYYADTLPAWLTAWNARGGVARLAGATWSLLLPDSMYAEADRQPFENGGRDLVFPHRLPTDLVQLQNQVSDSPWIDSLTLDVALAGSRALQLGQRGRPDLLAVSLSGTDFIGHTWGPDSREIHDHLLRLDRWLGRFLDSLAVTVPGQRLLVVLTADHGVTSYPEFALAHGRPGGHIGLGVVLRDVNAALASRVGQSDFLKQNQGLIYGDLERLRAVGVSPESLATKLAPRVWSLPGVLNAWTPATLAGAVPTDVHAARWWRALPAKFPWLVCGVAKPGYVWGGSTSAAHGTTNQDDVGVPIAFLGAAIQPGLYPDTVRTVDIAPTLAKVLNVKTRGRLDGRTIRRAIR